MKNEESAKALKAAYVPPTFQKQQLVEEVLRGPLPTTHGPVG